MDICMLVSGKRCPICTARKEREERILEIQFDQLASAVWKGDIQECVRILKSNSRLANYRGFTFHLPQKSKSILAYAKACGQKTIFEILVGFGAE